MVKRNSKSKIFLINFATKKKQKQNLIITNFSFLQTNKQKNKNQIESNNYKKKKYIRSNYYLPITNQFIRFIFFSNQEILQLVEIVVHSMVL